MAFLLILYNVCTVFCLAVVLSEPQMIQTAMLGLNLLLRGSDLAMYILWDTAETILFVLRVAYAVYLSHISMKISVAGWGMVLHNTLLLYCEFEKPGIMSVW